MASPPHKKRASQRGKRARAPAKPVQKKRASQRGKRARAPQKKQGDHRGKRPSQRTARESQRRRRDLQRKNEDTRTAQDIDDRLEELAADADDKRRKAACADFRVFCETYFPNVFHLPWSKDHLRIIAKLEQVASQGGLFAFAMPRGSGKSSLSRTGALWAILSLRRRYVCLLGSASRQAKSLLQGIQAAIQGNAPLQADFWRELGPFVALGNNAHKQKGQRYQGELTHVRWEAEAVVVGTIPDSEASGSVITVAGLDANIRGHQYTRIDGTILRPDLVLLDDPQTRESAYSAEQTRRRIEILAGDVLGLAGPGTQIAAFLACTKIVEGDLACQVLNKDQLPDWQGECTKMLHSFPKAKKEWEQYDLLRIKGIGNGSGLSAATAYYLKHRKGMDAGAIAAWPARFDPEREISAVQHAMNLFLRPYSAGGGDAFMAEYQNEPATEHEIEDRLTADQVVSKYNGRKRATVAASCVKLTAFIDVHDNLLFYCVCAWEPDFTGYVIDYGTFPEQGRASFVARTPARSLQKTTREGGKDAAICAGLEKLVSVMLAMTYIRDDGVLMKVDRLLIDKNYKPHAVEAAVRRIDSNIIRMARGVPVTASKKPFADYQRKPGQQIGYHWMVPSLRGTQRGTLRYVAVDVNFWKTFCHARLAVGAGAPGCLSLYGTKRTNHRLFVEHIVKSENWRLITDNASGRVVAEWKQYPSKPDNHWFDCLVGCCAAASMESISLEGMKLPEMADRRRVVVVPRRR